MENGLFDLAQWYRVQLAKVWRRHDWVNFWEDIGEEYNLPMFGYLDWEVEF